MLSPRIEHILKSCRLDELKNSKHMHIASKNIKDREIAKYAKASQQRAKLSGGKHTTLTVKHLEEGKKHISCPISEILNYHCRATEKSKVTKEIQMTL